MAKCAICKASVGNIIISKSKCYCEMCWYHENAPILVLAKTWDVCLPTRYSNCEQLFNPKLNKYVHPANGQMEKCGFKLFNRKQFFNRKTNKNYKEVLTYKYNGHSRCLALSEYKAWPTKMPNCCKIGCTLK